MVIRDLVIEDIKSLSDLYYQFWGEESDMQKMKNKFAKLQNNDAYIFLGAVENETLLGSIMGIVCDELYGGCRQFLVVENFIVDAPSRRKGVGKALFAELEKRARARECTQIILVTETERKDARSFYESIGFNPTSNKGFKKKLL